MTIDFTKPVQTRDGRVMADKTTADDRDLVIAPLQKKKVKVEVRLYRDDDGVSAVAIADGEMYGGGDPVQWGDMEDEDNPHIAAATVEMEYQP